MDYINQLIIAWENREPEQNEEYMRKIYGEQITDTDGDTVYTYRRFENEEE